MDFIEYKFGILIELWRLVLLLSVIICDVRYHLLLCQLLLVLQLPPEPEDGAVFGLGGWLLGLRMRGLALARPRPHLGQGPAGERGLDVVHLLLHRVKCLLGHQQVLLGLGGGVAQSALKYLRLLRMRVQ